MIVQTTSEHYAAPVGRITRDKTKIYGITRNGAQGSMMLLGKYETEERAKEVYKDLESCLLMDNQPPRYTMPKE